jgi:hypothetical protein
LPTVRHGVEPPFPLVGGSPVRGVALALLVRCMLQVVHDATVSAG